MANPFFRNHKRESSVSALYIFRDLSWGLICYKHSQLFLLYIPLYLLTVSYKFVHSNFFQLGLCFAYDHNLAAIFSPFTLDVYLYVPVFPYFYKIPLQSPFFLYSYIPLQQPWKHFVRFAFKTTHSMRKSSDQNFALSATLGQLHSLFCHRPELISQFSFMSRRAL